MNNISVKLTPISFNFFNATEDLSALTMLLKLLFRNGYFVYVRILSEDIYNYLNNLSDYLILRIVMEVSRFFD